MWWRTKYNDLQHGRCIIATWDDLKREIKTQFFPENVAYLARRQLRELKQTGTVRKYVKKFSGLMLDIKDMSEENKLFYFLKGLKPWARIELQRQRVQDLVTAQTAAEHLTDYATESTQPKKANLVPLRASTVARSSGSRVRAKVGEQIRRLLSLLPRQKCRIFEHYGHPVVLVMQWATQGYPIPAQVQVECLSSFTRSKGAGWGRRRR